MQLDKLKVNALLTPLNGFSKGSATRYAFDKAVATMLSDVFIIDQIYDSIDYEIKKSFEAGDCPYVDFEYFNKKVRETVDKLEELFREGILRSFEHYSKDIHYINFLRNLYIHAYDMRSGIAIIFNVNNLDMAVKVN